MYIFRRVARVYVSLHCVHDLVAFSRPPIISSMEKYVFWSPLICFFIFIWQHFVIRCIVIRFNYVTQHHWNKKHFTKATNSLTQCNVHVSNWERKDNQFVRCITRGSETFFIHLMRGQKLIQSRRRTSCFTGLATERWTISSYIEAALNHIPSSIDWMCLLWVRERDWVRVSLIVFCRRPSRKKEKGFACLALSLVTKHERWSAKIMFLLGNTVDPA